MRPGSIAGVVIAGVLLPGTLAGCGATGGDNPRVVDRSRLANDLATRLARSASLTYTATYTLPGPASATIAQAQQPLRVAYLYSEGKVVVTPTEILDCRGAAGAHGSATPSPALTANSSPSQTAGPNPSPAAVQSGAAAGAALRCTLTSAPSAGTDAVTTLLGLVGDRGLVAPAAVAALLTAAALDLNAAIEQRDTTIAGENATCVDVRGLQNASASSFSACITAGGILGSFQGAVGGTEVNVTLDQYDEQVAPAVFEPPAGATVG
jgi:hypothetical protein